jgi:tyrosyl-tRNA synthetase
MSQSLGNYISIMDTPNDMFGKTMSIPDNIIANWFELCTDVSLEEVAAMLTEGKNPRDAKVRLAKEIVALYHSPNAANEAEQYFVETFSQRKVVTDAEEAVIPAELIIEGFVSLPALITALGLTPSNGKSKELIASGAVTLGGEKVTELRHPIGNLDGKILKVGKHQFKKLILEPSS